MIEARGSSTRTKHLIAGPWIQVNGNRAFSRCHANLYIRTEVDEQEIDLQSWICFFDLLEKRNNSWRIVKRTGVYEKDRMEPVDPRGFPKDFFADMDLSVFPASAKFLCYWLQRTGRPPSTNIISAYSDEERALKEEGDMWIDTAANYLCNKVRPLPETSPISLPGPATFGALSLPRPRALRRMRLS